MEIVIYFPLFCRSTYSICQAVPKTDDFALKLKSLGFSGCALADIGNLGGVPTFVKAMKKADLKPLIGCEFAIVDDSFGPDSPFFTIKVLARNQDGWKSLIKAVSASHEPSRHRNHPRLSLRELASFQTSPGSWYVFTGSPGSTLFAEMFADAHQTYQAGTPSAVKGQLRPDWSERVLRAITGHQELFGDSLWLDLILSDPENLPAQAISAEGMRWASKRSGVPCVASIDCRYFQEDDAVDLRLLQCIDKKSPMSEVLKKIAKLNDFRSLWMFRSRRFHLPTLPEMQARFSSGELQASLDIAENCEPPDVGGKVYTPNFTCPDGKLPDEYFREVCREGWRQKVDPVLRSLPTTLRTQKRQEYADRIRMELDVLTEAGFSTYFLMVRDYTIFARDDLKTKVGPGRGCLHPSTPIVMGNSQYKPIKDVSIGDMVICRDGVSRNVTNIFSYDCSEKLTSIFTYFGDRDGLSVTGDHLVLVEKASKVGERYKKIAMPTGNFDWVRADAVDVGDWLFVPTPITTHTSDQFYDMSSLCDGDVDVYDDSYVIQRKLGRWGIESREKKSPRMIPLDSDWAYIAGYFAGNGSFHNNKKHYVALSIDKRKTELIANIVRIISTVFSDVVVSESKSSNGANITINSRIAYLLFSKWFADYKCDPATKHVPYWIIGNSPDIVASFIDGYVAADGHYNSKNRSYRIKSISRQLICEARQLLSRIGRPSSIARVTSKDTRPGFQNCRQCWSIEFPEINNPAAKKPCWVTVDGGYAIRVRSVAISPSVGIVCDIEVESEHNYLTSSGIVHNSVGGSLASYLSDVTRIDPVKYGLLFERFVNKGRLQKDNLTYPDIDLDFEPDAREKIIKYLCEKYGDECVCQMGTFLKLKGRSALRDVLRLHDRCGAAEINAITDPIPDEAAITDELQLMRDRHEEVSIILWSLQNNADQLREWCHIDKDGQLQGDLALDFAQAIRLEGLCRGMGKHASGVVVTPIPVSDIVPMVYDKSTKGRMTGYDMRDSEAAGLLKVDILGLSTLTNLSVFEQLARTGSMK